VLHIVKISNFVVTNPKISPSGTAHQSNNKNRLPSLASEINSALSPILFFNYGMRLLLGLKTFQWSQKRGNVFDSAKNRERQSATENEKSGKRQSS